MTKTIFFIILAVLLFFIGFFILNWDVFYPGKEGTILEEVTYEPIENYEIIETEEGIFVENENVGLRFRVPDGWEIMREETETEKEMIFLSSPDSIMDANNFPASGCFVEVSVEHGEENFMLVQRQIKKLSIVSPGQDRELISVGDKFALKFSDTFLGGGKIVFLKTPIDNKIFNFTWANLSSDKTLCESYFDSFLKSVEFFQK